MTMADVRRLIQELKVNGTPEAIAATLNAKSVRIENHNRITAADMLAKFGAQKVMAWNSAFEAAGAGLLVQTVAATGLDFAHAETIKTILMFQQAKILDEAAAKDLLSIGVYYVSPWQVAGGVGEVTAEQVGVALAGIVSDELRQRVAERYNAIVSAMDSGTVTNWDAARAALGAE